MLLCDVSCCGRPAVVLVHFKTTTRAYPYCARHGLNRRGKAIFGRMRNGSWQSPVRHVERVKPTKEEP